MQNPYINTFEGGLNKDTALVSLPNNQYDEAQDCEFMSDLQGQQTIIKEKTGTGLAKFKVPNAQAQTKLFRVQTYTDNTRVGTPNYFTSQKFNLLDKQGNIVRSVSITNSNPLANNITFAFDLEAAFGGSTFAVVLPIVNNDQKYTTIELISPTFDNVYSIEQTVVAASGQVYNNKLIVLRDLIKTETQFEALAYVNSQNLGFILSVSEDNTITELGVVDEDNNWAYTRLLRTKDFILSKTEPISFLVEQQNDRTYCLYFTDYTVKDKCIIVPPSLEEDCCLTYTPSSYIVPSKGSYNLVQTDVQTNSQLINNIIHVKYLNTLQSGGGLTTGGKRYAVRCGINGSNITTEWSILSNIVPVYAASTDNAFAWVNVQGAPNGQPTSKRNILEVRNSQSDVFNFIELAVVNYAGEQATSAELVGRFDITSENFTITHSGLEQTTPLDVSTLIQAEPTLLKVKDIEIKKNRLNRANVEVANEDSKWQTIAENATLGVSKFEIESTGRLQDSIGNLRFNALFGGDITGTQYPEKQLITFTPTATTPPIPSPSSYAGGIYTVQAQDGNNLFLNVVVNGQIANPNTAAHTFRNMYIVVLKNDIEVASILVADSSSTETYLGRRIRFTGTTSFNVAVGDEIKLCVQLHCSDTGYIKFKSDAANGIGINMWQASSQTSLQFTETRLGEYQIPYNVANKAGYMAYEYYLGYVRFHLKNGYITAPYPIGKYFLNTDKFVRGLVQIIPPDNDTIFTDTSANAGRVVYNYGIQVSNLDITDVKDELIGISFERSEPLNTVIGSGIYHNARKFEGDIYTSGIYNISGTPLPISSNLRRFGLFISNDLVNKKITYSDGDYLKVVGIPNTLSYNDKYKSGTTLKGVINEFLGSLSTISADQMYIKDWAIKDSCSIDFNSIGNILANTAQDLYYKPSTSQTNNAYYNGNAVAVTTVGCVGTQNSDDPTCTEKNIYVAFYIRPIDLSTVDYRNYKPTPTGDIFKIENTTNPIFSGVMYGGDTYTQKVIRKTSYWYNQKVGDIEYNVSFVLGFYAQNRNNSQLFYTDTTAPIGTWNLQGSKSLFQYLFPFSASSEIVEEQFNFDGSYIGKNLINKVSPYNPILPYPTSNPTRIYYSDLKNVGSLYDAYRKVRPLNYVDLELQNGAISAIYDIRDVIVVIQPNFVGAIPYASDTLIQSDNTAKILVGSGTVYSNRVYPLSSYGTSLKTLSCKGYNTNGNPQVYWMSDDFTNFSRYDYSGVKILSVENNMRTFFINNVAHIKKEFDANIIYNTKKEEILITTRAVKQLDEWDSTVTYNAENAVLYGASGRWKNFEEIKSVYIAKSTNINTNPYDNPDIWESIPMDNTLYYNMWSLIFNERTNNFKTFFTPLQKRYFRHNNYTLTPRGTVELGKVYLMDNPNGEPLQWFPLTLGSTDYKQGRFKLSTVFNKFGNDKKIVSVSLERGDDALIDAFVSAITPTQNIPFPIKEKRREATYYPAYYDSNGDSPFGQYIKILIEKSDSISVRTIAGIFKNKFPLRIK